MSNKDEEQVLVIPTSLLQHAGLFQGLCTDVDHYLPLLLDPARFLYRPRAAVEVDPSFKQLIPYVVLRCGDLIFNYVRGHGAGEARLHALRSLGVGGHVSAEDVDGSADVYRTALLREVAEEVHLEGSYRERCIGLINDDRTPVGQVHLGIVHIFELTEPRARRREEALTQAGFHPLAELRERREEFESWSQFLLDATVLARE